jgi:hypothetical protein
MYYGPWANWHHSGTIVKTKKSKEKKKKTKKKREKKRKGLLLNNINIPFLTKSSSLSPNLTFLRLNNVFQEQLHPHSTFGLTRVFLALQIIFLFFLKPPSINMKQRKVFLTLEIIYLCIYLFIYLFIYCFLSLTYKHETETMKVSTYQGKDIVFRFIIEYSSLRDFGP